MHFFSVVLNSQILKCCVLGFAISEITGFTVGRSEVFWSVWGVPVSSALQVSLLHYTCHLGMSVS